MTMKERVSLKSGSASPGRCEPDAVTVLKITPELCSRKLSKLYRCSRYPAGK